MANPLDPEFQVVASCLACVLGRELGSSAGAARALSHLSNPLPGPAALLIPRETEGTSSGGSVVEVLE